MEKEKESQEQLTVSCQENLRKVTWEASRTAERCFLGSFGQVKAAAAAAVVFLAVLDSGISNGLLQEWPKVLKCKQAMSDVLDLHAGTAPQQQAAEGQQHPGAAAAHPQPPASVQQQSAAALHSAVECCASKPAGIHTAATAADPPFDAHQVLPAAGEGAAAAAGATAGCGSAGPVTVAAADGGSDAAVGTASAEQSRAVAGASGSDDAAAGAGGVTSPCGVRECDLPWALLLNNVMGDSARVPDDQEVPLTGVGEQLDRQLSAIFIQPFEIQVHA